MKSEYSEFVDTLTALNRTSRQFISEQYSELNAVSESAAVLLKLLANGGTEHWTQTKLAQEMCVSESSLCTLIERLRNEQLLQRERDAIDRRKTRLSLTPQGRLAAEQISLTDRKIEAALQKHLSNETKISLVDACQSLLEACKKSQLDGDLTRRAA
ncbi:MarR family winged helix-turn-helix transcriptional regulator [Thalassoglobus sp.]|uniref:MarR family winged helix-turn-helix transcriptional regulator n=1 Tax=Thalassoglobus sp. TaxID=2795869 RepID=UPI003AA7D8AE